MVMTDTRKPVMLTVEPNVGCSDGCCTWALSASLTVRPVANVSLSLGPSWTDDRTRSQYVTTVADPTATAMYGKRYVFAYLRQKTLAMDTRLSVTFTPTLTLELYLQPLIASGAYTAFHEFDRPRALRAEHVRRGPRDHPPVYARRSRRLSPWTPTAPAGRRGDVHLRQPGLQLPLAARQRRRAVGVPPRLDALPRLDPVARGHRRRSGTSRWGATCAASPAPGRRTSSWSR